MACRHDAVKLFRSVEDGDIRFEGKVIRVRHTTNIDELDRGLLLHALWEEQTLFCAQANGGKGDNMKSGQSTTADVAWSFIVKLEILTQRP